jgi:hypothetical protein
MRKDYWSGVGMLGKSLVLMALVWMARSPLLAATAGSDLPTTGATAKFLAVRDYFSTKDTLTPHPRRSSSARIEFKHLHPCPSNGHSTGSCSGYVIDHVNPLKRGGSDAPSNMQWQTKSAEKAKDRWKLL